MARRSRFAVKSAATSLSFATKPPLSHPRPPSCHRKLTPRLRPPVGTSPWMARPWGLSLRMRFVSDTMLARSTKRRQFGEKVSKTGSPWLRSICSPTWLTATLPTVLPLPTTGLIPLHRAGSHSPLGMMHSQEGTMRSQGAACLRTSMRCLLHRPPPRKIGSSPGSATKIQCCSLLRTCRRSQRGARTPRQT